jgi:hypothetical protein
LVLGKHAYNCENSWPWQKKWWADWNGAPEPFAKKMKRLGSFFVVILGFNAFWLALFFLVFLIGMAFQ